MFVDIAKINVKAGSGGNGCESFYRDRNVQKGKPNGGHGGNGGNIIFQTNSGIQTLLDFQYRQHFKAERGTHGSSNNKNGKTGADCVIKVPCGTLIRDQNSKAILRDLVGENERVIVCRGGKGGRGNSRKRRATFGEPGEEKDLLLELKLIADVGIIGYPNAGKSTLISRISQARPKVASYPFTTKTPNLGVVRIYDKHIVIADIPGLIQGAHKGKGLGDRFLRHVERTKILLHLIDAAAIDGRSPVSDYHSLNKELALYSKSLMKKPQIVVANKMDMPQAKQNLKELQDAVENKVYAISALTGEGLKELLTAIGKIL